MESGLYSLHLYNLSQKYENDQRKNYLFNLILEGKALEGFDGYYNDQVVIQENENAATIGKELNRQREIDFFASIAEFRGAKAPDVAAGENTS